jgi:hypothetical protein
MAGTKVGDAMKTRASCLRMAVRAVEKVRNIIHGKGWAECQFSVFLPNRLIWLIAWKDSEYDPVRRTGRANEKDQEESGFKEQSMFDECHHSF